MRAKMSYAIRLISLALITLLANIRDIHSSCEDHKHCMRFERHKTFYCKQKWVQQKCRQMCQLCSPECKNHRVCKVYEKHKSYYCRHKWMREHYCPEMCGHCVNECQREDHKYCSAYVMAPGYYCPHKWLRKNCQQMCGGCSVGQGPQWPEGEYAILSSDPCPPDWVEFNHCMDNENDNNKDELEDFKLSPGFKCEKTSVSFRYCFKGPKIPTRKGGFWTKYGATGSGYIIRSPLSECSAFGEDGGIVEIDNEDHNNQNSYGNNGLNMKYYYNYHPFDFILSRYPRTRLSFCKIGGEGMKTTNVYIEVGNFNYQSFGIFVTPGSNCPKLKSPQGMMEGSKQEFFIDDENYLSNSRVVAGHPPVVFENGGTKLSACHYDPNKAIKHYKTL